MRRISCRRRVVRCGINFPTSNRGAEALSLDSTLQWQSGAFGSVCDVYFGTDFNNVNEATRADDRGVLVSQAQAESVLDPGILAPETTYYWRVDMVDTADSTTLKGYVWSFSTSSGIVIDDMERYNNDPNLWIYMQWADGWDDPDNGSVVGNGDLAETVPAFVYEGAQSLPMSYDNSLAKVSEITMVLADELQDWGLGTLNALSLYYRGLPGPSYSEDANGVITVSGCAGIAYRDTTDCPAFAYQTLHGDGAIVAKICSVDYIQSNSNGAIMIREELTPSARYAAVLMKANGTVQYHVRREAGDVGDYDYQYQTDAQKNVTFPIWLKLERKGNEFYASYTMDEAGTDWISMSWSPQTVEMVEDVYIGLSGAGDLDDYSGSAQFTDVSTTGNVTGERTLTVIGGEETCPANTAQSLYLIVKDSAQQEKVIVTQDAAASISTTWTQWLIPYSDMAGLDLNHINSLTIGVGDPDATAPSGATGKIWIDDIRLIDSDQ